MQLTQVLVSAVVLCTLLENVGGFVTPSTAVPALSKARHTKTARGRVHRATSTADPSSSSSQRCGCWYRLLCVEGRVTFFVVLGI